MDLLLSGELEWVLNRFGSEMQLKKRAGRSERNSSRLEIQSVRIMAFTCQKLTVFQVLMLSPVKN